MISLFGAKKPDHPMAVMKEARKILGELPGNDAFKATDELSHWLESVIAAEGFKPDYRAQLIQMLDEAAQPHVRKLARDYVSSPRLAKFQETRLWTVIFEFYRHAAQGYAACVDAYASGAKGADALKAGMPLLLTRALRALAAQVKWMYMRYGPMDESVWGVIARIYALSEGRKLSRVAVAVYPAAPGESTPEQEFLKAVMLSASSPNSLLPTEMELCERLIAHFAASFTLRLDQQPDIAYWIDLATGHAPLRLARPPQHAPTLRFFTAGKALEELDALTKTVKSTNAVPAQLPLGGAYPVETVQDVLNHLALHWSPKPAPRKHPRHQVKSRLNVTHGFAGVTAVLDASEGSLSFEGKEVETWIVENVSAGGFGAGIPQIKGDWLKIGVLLGLQPEGGTNWVLGVIRRVVRDSPFKGSVGVQTIARAAQLVHFSAGGATESGLVISDASDTPGEARVLLRAGSFVPGQNLEYQKGEASHLLMPQGVIERGEEYEMVKFREMIRDTSE